MFTFVFGGSFLAVGLLPVLLLPLLLVRGARTNRLVTDGAEAIGTVQEVRDTGVTINDNPRVELRLRIDPVDGSPSFEGTKKVTVSRIAVPYPGQRFPVWFDPAKRHVFGLGVDVDEQAPPAVRRLFALAEAQNPMRPQAGADPRQAAGADPVERLRQLHELRRAGALTEAEFETMKSRVLNGY
jgi:hypothetical protein